MLKYIPYTAVATALVLGLSAAAQTSQLPCSVAYVYPGVQQSTAADRFGVDLPYSLTAIIKAEKKLPDGNVISGFTTARQTKDSQGRTRVDAPNNCVPDRDGEPLWHGSITINDPSTKTRTWWLSGNKTAIVSHDVPSKISPPLTSQQQLHLAQSMARPQREGKEQKKFEDLGKRNIAGLDASGWRVTRIMSPGEVGNTLPLTYVEETWMSDRYGIYLLVISDDPIMGNSSYEVTSFTPVEPDPALFQPPADFKIEDHPFVAAQ